MNRFSIFFILTLVVALCHLTSQVPSIGARENKPKNNEKSEVVLIKGKKGSHPVQQQEKNKADHVSGGQIKFPRKSNNGPNGVQKNTGKYLDNKKKSNRKTKNEKKKQPVVHLINKKTDKVKMTKHLGILEQLKMPNSLSSGEFVQYLCIILRAWGLAEIISINPVLSVLCASQSTTTTVAVDNSETTLRTTANEPNTNGNIPTEATTKRLVPSTLQPAISTGAPVPGCDKTFDQSSGVFTSPNYPGDYGNNLYCSFLIRAATDQIISLTFTDFVTQDNVDVVEVYDGSTTSGLLLQRVSGQNQDAIGPIESYSSQMLVLLKTDGSVVNRGFFAKYKTFTGSRPIGTTQHYWNYPTTAPSTYTNGDWLFTNTRYPATASPTYGPYNQSTSDCIMNNGYGFNSYGSLTSVNYPLPYANSLYCSVGITVSYGTRITLSFFDFDTESGFDFVEVYDGLSLNSPMLLRASGSSIPDTVQSTSTQMTVLFRTDGSVTGRGFSAWYTASDGIASRSPFTTYPPPTPSSAYPTTSPSITGCGDTSFFYVSGGTLTSPGYPYPYGSFVSCLYTIMVAPGYRVFLSFSAFDTQSSDYVTVYDGLTTYSPMLLMASGPYIPSFVMSTSNEMLVSFNSGFTFSGNSGFLAFFVAVPSSNFPTSTPPAPPPWATPSTMPAA